MNDILENEFTKSLIEEVRGKDWQEPEEDQQELISLYYNKKLNEWKIFIRDRQLTLSQMEIERLSSLIEISLEAQSRAEQAREMEQIL